MIKKIEYTESPFSSRDNSKFAKFAQDIKEIIENKIEYAELVDMPYADSTANEDLAYKSRIIFRGYHWDVFKCAPEKTDLFKFAKQTKEDGVHWYVHFDTEEFMKMVIRLGLSEEIS